MDSNVTAGTRDLALSGSFVMPVAAVRLRAEQGKPAAGCWLHGCRAHLAVAGIGATVLHSTSLIGTDVPVIDRMRVSAAEP